MINVEMCVFIYMLLCVIEKDCVCGCVIVSFGASIDISILSTLNLNQNKHQRAFIKQLSYFPHFKHWLFPPRFNYYFKGKIRNVLVLLLGVFFHSALIQVTAKAKA